MVEGRRYLLVCRNIDCKARGADEIMATLQKRLEERGVDDIEVREYMCFGACHEAPNIVLHPNRAWFAAVKPEEAEAIVEHVCGGTPADHLMNKIDPTHCEFIYQLLDAGLF